MECSEPGAIRDEELLAYMDGSQVRPAVFAHLADCQHCSAQLATYQRMDRKLIQRLYRWDCPTNQVLGEYQLGLLSSERAARVQDHLLRCVLCAAEVVVFMNFMANDPLLIERVGAVGVVPSADPASTSSQGVIGVPGQGVFDLPGQVVNNLHDVHPVRAAKHMIEQWRTEGMANVRRIVATLLSPEPRMAYQRDIVERTGANPTPVWPRRYSAEGLTISIQVERTPQHAHQRGSLQLLGLVTYDGRALEELQGTSVLLSSQTKAGDKHEQDVYVQVIDDLGNFVFSALEPDTYMLEFQLPERVIAIEELSLTL